MLGDDNRNAAMGLAKECKIDPEEMLQSARKRKEKAKADIESFRKLNDYHQIEEKTMLALFGAMHVSYYSAIDTEHRWLEEIDKD